MIHTTYAKSSSIMRQHSSPCSGDLLELEENTKKLLIFLQGGGMCAPSIEGEQLSKHEHI